MLEVNCANDTTIAASSPTDCIERIKQVKREKNQEHAQHVNFIELIRPPANCIYIQWKCMLTSSCTGETVRIWRISPHGVLVSCSKMVCVFGYVAPICIRFLFFRIRQSAILDKSKQDFPLQCWISDHTHNFYHFYRWYSLICGRKKTLPQECRILMLNCVEICFPFAWSPAIYNQNRTHSLHAWWIGCIEPTKSKCKKRRTVKSSNSVHLFATVQWPVIIWCVWNRLKFHCIAARSESCASFLSFRFFFFLFLSCLI